MAYFLITAVFLLSQIAGAAYIPSADQAGSLSSASSDSTIIHLQAYIAGSGSSGTPRYSSFRTKNASYQVSAGKTFYAQFMDVQCHSWSSAYGMGVGIATADYNNESATTTPTGWDPNYFRGTVDDGILAMPMGISTVANPKSTYNMAGVTFNATEWPLLVVVRGDASCVVALYGREI